MSSRFVSSGAIDAKTGESVPVPTTTTTTAAPAHKSAEWAAVQAQLDHERQQRRAATSSAADPNNNDNRSLYEVLQANKAAKQAAFEEANKIKNQFRALDEDEIEFLDEVREKKRREEERERREMEDGLRVFRERQKGVGAVVGGGRRDRKEGEGEGAEGENEDGNGEVEIEMEEGKAEATAENVVGGWAVARKRKRRRDGDEGLLKGVKRRRSSGLAVEEAKMTGKEDKAAAQGDIKVVKDGDTPVDDKTHETGPKATVSAAPIAPAAPSKPKMGLVDYGSDDDSD